MTQLIGLMGLAAAMALSMLAQEPVGARLQLVPSEPLREPEFPIAERSSKPAVRPAILKLKPAGDPILPEEVPAPGVDAENWKTYRRPRVHSVSRDGNGLAIHGYDVVSLHERNPARGAKQFAHEYKGVIWLFSTAAHLAEFKQSPDRYVPEYGGFCAYSIANGYPATADPRHFTVEGGKLYLFYDGAVQSVWSQDRRSMVTKAELNWPRLHR